MQPNEITLANMGQVARANAAKQDPQLQGALPAPTGAQALGLPLKGVIGSTPVNAGPTAAGPVATVTSAPSNGIIAGQMLAGQRK